jgi:hypothetical protein
MTPPPTSQMAPVTQLVAGENLLRAYYVSGSNGPGSEKPSIDSAFA